MSITKSLFAEYVDKYFPGVVKSYTEKWNGQRKEEQHLLPEMSTEEYSADMTFTSTSLNHSVVAADVVSLSSPLPLKQRGSIGKATGVIPKIGLKFSINEKELSDLMVMGARGAKEQEIVRKVLNDVPNAIKGVDVRNEILFEQGLSTGVIAVEDDKNTGVAIRLDFGYKAENIVSSTLPWGNAGYTPATDTAKMFAAADAAGNKIGVLLISKKYFDLFRSSEEGKLMSANFRQLTYTASTKLPQPSRQQMIDAMADEYGCEIVVVNTTCQYEKNGQKKSYKPWEQANVVGIPQKKIARVVYGTLVEEARPVDGVSYEKSGNYILVSKFAHNEPLEEFTAAQALCLPVIDDVDQIYLLKADQTA